MSSLDSSARPTSNAHGIVERAACDSQPSFWCCSALATTNLQGVEHVPQDVRETFRTRVSTENGVEDRDLPEDARYEIMLKSDLTCSNHALSTGQRGAVLNRVGCSM